MPLYLCLCPDYPNVFERRLAAREAHLAGLFPHFRPLDIKFDVDADSVCR